MDQRVNHEAVFVTPDGRFDRSILSYSWITLSSNLFGVIINKKILRVTKIAEIGAYSENCFFGNKTLVTSKVCLKTLEGYFIKWTTSGVPPMGLRNPLEGYFWRNKQELSDQNSQRPCTAMQGYVLGNLSRIFLVTGTLEACTFSLSGLHYT